MRSKNIFALLILLILTGCAFAPFSETNTARSVGASQQSVQAGIVEGRIPYVHYEYGVLANLDAGAQFEYGLGSYTMGFSTKYSFLNNGQGLAAALIGGFGKEITGDSQYWYLGPVVSNRFAFFEPAVSLRYTSTESDAVDVNTASGGITYSGEHLRYWYLTLSGTIYPAEWLGIIFQLSNAIMTKGDNGEDVTDGFIMSVGFKYKL